MTTPPQDHDRDQVPADKAPAAASRPRRFRTPAVIVAGSLAALLLGGSVFAGGVAVGRFSDRGDRGFGQSEAGHSQPGPGSRMGGDSGNGERRDHGGVRPGGPREDISDRGQGDGDDGTEG